MYIFILQVVSHINHTLDKCAVHPSFNESTLGENTRVPDWPIPCWKFGICSDICQPKHVMAPSPVLGLVGDQDEPPLNAGTERCPVSGVEVMKSRGERQERNR